MEFSLQAMKAKNLRMIVKYLSKQNRKAKFTNKTILPYQQEFQEEIHPNPSSVKFRCQTYAEQHFYNKVTDLNKDFTAEIIITKQ